MDKWKAVEMGVALPLDPGYLESLALGYGTPLHVYDERGIKENARAFLGSFSWNEGFRQYFAVKATPTPAIIERLSSLGMGMDCSSLAELELCRRLGIRGESVMFTSNDTSEAEFRLASRLGAIINLDDISHIGVLRRACGLPPVVCLRYNPGDPAAGNSIIGRPREAKFGIPRGQLMQGYRTLREMGVERFGLHTMVVSNELDPGVFAGVASMMFRLAVEIRRETGVEVEFVNLGGGLGIPYRPGQAPIDVASLAARIRDIHSSVLGPAGMGNTRVFTECGRFVTGPYGCLLSRVLHVKRTYKTFVGLDACMADLMRPGMYGAYHHITVIGREGEPCTMRCDVTGSLCENNDKFAVDRLLPEMAPGDLVAIHDTGAHGHAMGFNYNGKLRSAEVLAGPDGRSRLIRRAETLEDYFATVQIPGSRFPAGAGGVPEGLGQGHHPGCRTGRSRIENAEVGADRKPRNVHEAGARR
jgi:diaminopimelate decarboxylase